MIDFAAFPHRFPVSRSVSLKDTNTVTRRSPICGVYVSFHFRCDVASVSSHFVLHTVGLSDRAMLPGVAEGSGNSAGPFEQATAMKVFNSVGIRVLGCDGLDTGSGSGNLLLTFKGVMAEEYLKELANRTRRGLQSAALEGSHTGGRCFGYENVPLPHNGNSKRRPSKLVVDPAQAEIVRRIF